MAQLLVRQIEEDVKQRLKQRAARRGVSVEEEVRTILRDAVRSEAAPQIGMGTRIANLFKDIPDNDEPLPELQDTPLRPINFDK